jgi:hypothetical protein
MKIASPFSLYCGIVTVVFAKMASFFGLSKRRIIQLKKGGIENDLSLFCT